MADAPPTPDAAAATPPARFAGLGGLPVRVRFAGLGGLPVRIA
jgi:hypothetical protein